MSVLEVQKKEKLDALRIEREGLIARKNAIQARIRDIGISKQAIWKNQNRHRIQTIPVDLIEERNKLASELSMIDVRLIEIRKERQIINPVDRSGIKPKSNPERIDETKKYRELCENLLNNLIDARKALTQVNLNGCNLWGTGEFMKVISPVNQALMPIAEYEKIKRINHLK